MLTTDSLKRLWIFSFDRTLTAAGACYAKARLHRVTRQFLEELAALPGHRVAVLSSRPLDDLVSRVPIEGIYLGGSCGTEWHIPGGESMTLSGKPKDMLMETRDALLPTLRAVADLPGVELEDRRWSAALHTQEANTKARQTLFARLAAVLKGWRVALYRHTTMVEIQFLPEITMAFGAQALCRFLGYRGDVVCAGSDENDATALRWALNQGGTALSLGRDPLVPGARPVVDVRSLARHVRDLAGIDEHHRTRMAGRRLCNAA